jgi:tetratricopeptide (TPR) repeat protein
LTGVQQAKRGFPFGTPRFPFFGFVVKLIIKSLSRFMSTTSPVKPSKVRLPVVIVLVVLALTAWGFNLWQQSRSAPVRAHLEAGMKYLEQGQGASAESEWKQAVQLDNRNVEAWEFLANYYTAAGDFGAAREAWNHVLELRPATPQVHFHLATCNARLNDFKAARHHAEEQLKLDPNHIGALDILTTVMESRVDEKPRLKYLRHLVELQPENPDYIGRLAEALADDQQYAEARPLLDKLIKKKPDLGPAYSLRGAAILYTDSSPAGLQMAISDLKRALAQDPSDAVALLYIGKVFLKLKKPQEAIKYLQRLDPLPTAHISYLYELAAAYQMLGNVPKAREIRERYAALQQESVEVERLETRLSNHPKDFDALLQLGLLLLSSRKPVGAEGYINSAVALRPHDARALNASRQLERVYTQHLNAGLAALKKRDFSKVSSNIGRAMMIRPGDARTANALQELQLAAPGTNVNPSPHMP